MGGFLFGPAPIRRTLPYLTGGVLHMKPRVKIMEIHYNVYWEHQNRVRQNRHQSNPYPGHDAHVGLREFYFWNVPQIQYMNPELQIVRFMEKTPNPFIRCWLDSGKDVIFECDSQPREAILDRLVRTLGKTEAMLRYEALTNVSQLSTENQAIFGRDRERFCMCCVPGQCPCPSVIKLPNVCRGLFRQYKTEDAIKQETEVVEGGAPMPDFDIPYLAKVFKFKS